MNIGRGLKKLIKRLNSGRVDAFEKVVNVYYDTVFNYISQHVKSEEVARSLVQKTFMLVWKKRNALSVKDFDAFLNRTVNQLIFDHLRKAADDQKLEEELWNQIQSTRIPDPVWEEKEVPDEALPRTIHQTFLLGQLTPELQIP